jgi:nicotinate-nucleotide adenylyltransferase
MESIALFGGSFDPPHNGHRAIVKAAQKLDFLDKIIVMPTYLNPFKSNSHHSPQKRLELTHEMFDGFEKVEISDFEISQGQKTPSITTVKHLLKKYDKIYLIIGADNLASLDRWQDYQELKKLVTFIVATRDDIEIPKKYIKLDVDEKISSTQIRESYKLEK